MNVQWSGERDSASHRFTRLEQQQARIRDRVIRYIRDGEASGRIRPENAAMLIETAKANYDAAVRLLHGIWPDTDGSP
ncbi:MAG TPA: hypothetical protein VKD26_14220 [Streptosporangiaceae bacterium]|nr:hypothetical protein [Streptosporangiaceae bacterium]